MTPALLFALGASFSAAVSTALKFHSAQLTTTAAWARRLPPAVASIVAQPVFVLALVFDAAGIGLQIAALKVGSLALVQPVLSAALVFSIGLNHLIDRTRVTSRELLYGTLLISSLATFLLISKASAAEGSAAIGERGPATALAVAGALIVGGGYLLTRAMAAKIRARTMAVGVAAIYATTAGLMKSVTNIAQLRGLEALLLSWQLWVLLAIATLGLVLNQRAFGLAPLTVTLPVIASLDPLFSVLIGVSVYGETLRSTPLALLGEIVSLGVLLLAIIKLTMLPTKAEASASPIV